MESQPRKQQPSAENLVLSLLAEIAGQEHPAKPLKEYLESPDRKAVTIDPAKLDALIVTETIARLRMRTGERAVNASRAIELQQTREGAAEVTEEQTDAAQWAAIDILGNTNYGHVPNTIVAKLVKIFQIVELSDQFKETIIKQLEQSFNRTSTAVLAKSIVENYFPFATPAEVKAAAMTLLIDKLYTQYGGSRLLKTNTRLTEEELVELGSLTEDDQKIAATKVLQDTVHNGKTSCIEMMDAIIDDCKLDRTHVEAAINQGLIKQLNSLMNNSIEELQIRAILNHYEMTPSAELIEAAQGWLDWFISARKHEKAKIIITEFGFEVSSEIAAQLETPSAPEQRGGF